MDFIRDVSRQLCVLGVKPIISAVAWLLAPAPIERSGYGTRGRPTVVETVSTVGIQGRRQVEQYNAELIVLNGGDDDIEHRNLSIQDLQVGDVLVGIRVGWKRGPKDYLIQKLTRGAASHAGIVGGNEEVFDAIGAGVRRSPIHNFVGEYSYVIAIQPWGMSADLREKIACVLPNYNGSYDYVSAIKTAGRSLERDAKQTVREGILRTTSETYICSDFVRRVLWDAGLPDPGFAGRVSTPSDFANDTTGQLVGYLVAPLIVFHPYDTSRTLAGVDKMALEDDPAL